jgi:hypothetical protein
MNTNFEEIFQVNAKFYHNHLLFICSGLVAIIEIRSNEVLLCSDKVLLMVFFYADV